MEKKSRHRGPAWALFACAWCVESSSVFGFRPGLLVSEITKVLHLQLKNKKSYGGPSVSGFSSNNWSEFRTSEHWEKNIKSPGLTKGIVRMRLKFYLG